MNRRDFLKGLSGVLIAFPILRLETPTNIPLPKRPPEKEQIYREQEPHWAADPSVFHQVDMFTACGDDSFDLTYGWTSRYLVDGRSVLCFVNGKQASVEITPWGTAIVSPVPITGDRVILDYIARDEAKQGMLEGTNR